MGQERVMNLLEHLRGRLLDSVITPTWDGMGWDGVFLQKNFEREPLSLTMINW